MHYNIKPLDGNWCQQDGYTSEARTGFNGL
jgi:hypothetical protein